LNPLVCQIVAGIDRICDVDFLKDFKILTDSSVTFRFGCFTAAPALIESHLHTEKQQHYSAQVLPPQERSVSQRSLIYLIFENESSKTNF